MTEELLQIGQALGLVLMGVFYAFYARGRGRMADLQAEFAPVDARLRSLEDEKSALMAQISEMKHERETQKAWFGGQIELMKNSWESAIRKNTQQEIEMKRLHEGLNEVRAEVVKLRTEHQDKDQRIEALQRRIEEAEKSRQAAEEGRVVVEKERDMLRVEVHNLKTEVDQLKRDLDATRKMLDDTRGELEKVNTMRQAMTEELVRLRVMENGKPAAEPEKPAE